MQQEQLGGAKVDEGQLQQRAGHGGRVRARHERRVQIKGQQRLVQPGEEGHLCARRGGRKEKKKRKSRDQSCLKMRMKMKNEKNENDGGGDDDRHFFSFFFFPPSRCHQARGDIVNVGHAGEVWPVRLGEELFHQHRTLRRGHHRMIEMLRAQATSLRTRKKKEKKRK